MLPALHDFFALRHHKDRPLPGLLPAGWHRAGCFRKEFQVLMKQNIYYIKINVCKGRKTAFIVWDRPGTEKDSPAKRWTSLFLKEMKHVIFLQILTLLLTAVPVSLFSQATIWSALQPAFSLLRWSYYTSLKLLENLCCPCRANKLWLFGDTLEVSCSSPKAIESAFAWNNSDVGFIFHSHTFVMHTHSLHP